MILDVTKPGLDGFGTLEELRPLSKIPVIILIDPDDDDQKVRGVSLGADDYLTKPFTQRNLLARLRPQLRRSEQQFWPAATAIAPPPSLPRGGRARG